MVRRGLAVAVVSVLAVARVASAQPPRLDTTNVELEGGGLVGSRPPGTTNAQGVALSLRLMHQPAGWVIFGGVELTGSTAPATSAIAGRVVIGAELDVCSKQSLAFLVAVADTDCANALFLAARASTGYGVAELRDAQTQVRGYWSFGLEGVVGYEWSRDASPWRFGASLGLDPAWDPGRSGDLPYSVRFGLFIGVRWK